MEESIIVAYYPLFLLILGTVFNLLVLIVLCRPRFLKDKKKRSTLHYMRAIAIFDILMFYDWNLDHYLSSVHGFTILRLSIASCKFAMFFGYFTAQISAWLRVFVCIDRYLILSQINITWFSRQKTAIGFIIGTIIFIGLLNIHFLFFNCYYQFDGSINIDSSFYKILPYWDYVHLAVYNFIPFVIMISFNIGVVRQLLNLRRETTLRNSKIQHRAISITLLITTFWFLLMTVPASLCFALFTSITHPTLLRMVDGALFTYHILSFPIYFLTYDHFRHEVLFIFYLKKGNRQIVPSVGAVTYASIVRKQP